MFSKAEKVFAGALVIACAILGIIGYSSPSSSDPPSKIWFDTGGGDVIFDHDYHVSFSGCDDCHHGYDEEDDAPDFEMNCRACHYYGEEGETPSDDETHVRYIGANCVGCHDDMAMEVSCDSCHIQQGYAFEASGSVMPSLPESVLLTRIMGRSSLIISSISVKTSGSLALRAITHIWRSKAWKV